MAHSPFALKLYVIGANNSYNAESKVRRYFWLIIFWAGMALTVWAVYQVIFDYRQYPVNTTIKLKRQSNVS